MDVIAGIGVEVTRAGLHAVAIASDGAVVGEQQLAGVAGRAELSAALGRMVGALGGPGVPVALAWDDGRNTDDAVDLGRGRPVEFAAQLHRWATTGASEVTVVADEDGGHWGVAVGSTSRIGDAVRRAAEHAGLAVVACEPVAVARARRAGVEPAESMATVAAGRLAPPVRLTIPAVAAGPEDLVWVIERQPEEAPNAQPAPPPRRRSRIVAALRRAVAAN